MAYTLLLKLAGPIQSWGSSSKFGRRETENEPTRSGVVGMVAGAMGMDRGESLRQFDNLKFGVRIDQPGEVFRDYHIVKLSKDMRSYLGSKTEKKVTERYYLSDAIFVVGLESTDRAQLEAYKDALNKPYYTPYLGRRSCPLTSYPVLGIVEGTVEAALRGAEWQATKVYRRQIERAKKDTHLTLVLENSLGIHRRHDVPISYEPNRRQYSYRYIDYLIGAEQGVTVYKAPAEEDSDLHKDTDFLAALD